MGAELSNQALAHAAGPGGPAVPGEGEAAAHALIARYASGDEEPAEMPDLSDPASWPDEPARDPADANDPDNWPDAGDPSDALNEEEDAEELSAEEQAAKAAMLGRAAANLLNGGGGFRARSASPQEVDPWDEFREEGDVVIADTPETAVYENRRGQVIVRQADPGGDHRDDPVIRFSKHYARNVIWAIARHDSGVGAAGTSPAISDVAARNHYRLRVHLAAVLVGRH